MSDVVMRIARGGTVQIAGGLQVNGSLELGVNRWHLSADGKYRFYFANNSTTYFGSGDGKYVFRSSGDNVDLVTIGQYTETVGTQGYISVYRADHYLIQIKTSTAKTWFMFPISSGSDYDLGFFYNNGSSTGVKGKVSYNGNGGYTNFTGSHRNITDDKSLYNSNYSGYIVKSTGKYKNLNSKYHKDYIKGNIIMDDALPIVELTKSQNDKSVWGVISYCESSSNNVRDYQQGHFTSCMDIENGDYRLVVNGCGEGSIWVSDYNGNLENGDYITSSDIQGIGMKQDDDILHTYTVAKITMDCDFNPKLIPVQVIKEDKYTIYHTSNYLTSNYEITSNEILTSNYEITSNEISTSNYEITSNEILTSNLVITSNEILTSNLVITSNEILIPDVKTSNLIDVEGNLVYENKLDEEGNIVYDYEYDMKYICLDGTIVDKEYYENNSNVYRMAFVGCSYKCS